MDGGEANEPLLRIRTRVEVLRRLAHVVTGALAVALVLTQFDVVRSVGVSLLTSAGVAGVVVGFAAQKSIGSLLAGLQLSVTQPIRIADSGDRGGGIWDDSNVPFPWSGVRGAAAVERSGTAKPRGRGTSALRAQLLCQHAKEG